jgi:hypothetical protein
LIRIYSFTEKVFFLTERLLFSVVKVFPTKQILYFNRKDPLSLEVEITVDNVMVKSVQYLQYHVKERNTHKVDSCECSQPSPMAARTVVQTNVTYS